MLSGLGRHFWGIKEELWAKPSNIWISIWKGGIIKTFPILIINYREVSQKVPPGVQYSAQEATLNLYPPGSLATISRNLGLRPVALRHTLSSALPFSDFLMLVFYLIPSSYSFRFERKIASLSIWGDIFASSVPSGLAQSRKLCSGRLVRTFAVNSGIYNLLLEHMWRESLVP